MIIENSKKTYHIEPQTGVAFEVSRGETIRVIDVEGEQCSDLMCFAQYDLTEYLSSGRTIDYNEKIYFTTDDELYSNNSNVMLTIGEDKVGKHDFLLTPCSQKMFEIIYGVEEYHPSCFKNLYTNLGEFGIDKAQIHTTFNIFMNVDVLPSGKIDIKPPKSKAGEYTEFRAEMDLVVGITACSAELSNNGSFKPIDVEIYEVPNSIK